MTKFKVLKINLSSARANLSRLVASVGNDPGTSILISQKGQDKAYLVNVHRFEELLAEYNQLKSAGKKAPIKLLGRAKSVGGVDLEKAISRLREKAVLAALGKP